MIWYRHGSQRKWHAVPHDQALPALGLKLLEEMAYRDSDNGYSEYVEFYDGVNGQRTYAYAQFSSYYGDQYGQLEEFVYGDIKAIEDSYSKHAVTPYPYTPDRDWILVGRHQ